MGRGNVCVHGEHEGLYYVDFDNYTYEYEDDYGETMRDHSFIGDDFDADMEIFSENFIKKFKSFNKEDKWISNSERVILENELFYVAVEDNDWSMAVKLLQKDQNHFNISNLQKKHSESYLKGMREILLTLVEKLGTYGGAWTHGTVTRE